MPQWWKIKGEEPEPENSNEWKRPPFFLMVLAAWGVMGAGLCFAEMNKRFYWGIPKYVFYAFAFFGMYILICWISGVFSKKLNKKKRKREFVNITITSLYAICIYSFFSDPKYFGHLQLLAYFFAIPIVFLLKKYWEKQDEKEKLKGGNENE